MQPQDNLSDYEVSNDSHSINSREVVAEAFAEYNHNSQPREVARGIGEAIEQALEKYRKGK
ncbi:hypothetical protein [Paenibacillus glacialis]|uniref:Uncharacterized protein n=1 Tax=Paenibacillus glacialis TaxID=494026 RepID=A0A168KVA6_9BACL|nr:hypothetical protein [Paenibacillus glacialis]OAB42514.1 hypothetical protein PGLA_12685 [Paenibacillus glacialis]